MVLSRDNPEGDPHAGSYLNIQTQYEKMRELVLERYDKVWIVEADMIVPPDALEKLLEVNADVVTGVYMLRHGATYTNISTPQGQLIDPKTLKRGIVRVGGGCMGCVVVDRKVLEDFSFIVGGQRAPDGEFMAYCRKWDFKQFARTDVVCGHITATGKVLWPEVN